MTAGIISDTGVPGQKNNIIHDMDKPDSGKTLSGLDRHVFHADHLDLTPSGRTLETHLIALAGADQG